MKVFIKDVENGWRVHYDVIGYDGNYGYKKVGEKEKAFVYDFEGEKENTWRRLEWFIAEKFLDSELHEKIYLLTYDEEGQEWVGNQEFKRRKDEKSQIKRLKEFDATHKPANPKDFTRREIKRSKEIHKEWDKQHASRLTPKTWQIECMENMFDDLLRHFKENDFMNYKDYVEIKNAAVRYFTKKYGLQPEES